MVLDKLYLRRSMLGPMIFRARVSLEVKSMAGCNGLIDTFSIRKALVFQKDHEEVELVVLIRVGDGDIRFSRSGSLPTQTDRYLVQSKGPKIVLTS